MTALKELVTAEALLIQADDGFCYELREGELHQMPPTGADHGATVMDLGAPLAIFVKQHNLGRTFGAETGFKIAQNPDTVLAPDISFVRTERVPQSGMPRGYFPGAPDLAVEVVSPGDTVYEVDERVERWLNAGAAQVWIVNPRRRIITVYTANGEQVLRVGNTLEGGELLPGFKLSLNEIFV